MQRKITIFPASLTMELPIYVVQSVVRFFPLYNSYLYLGGLGIDIYFLFSVVYNHVPMEKKKR